MIIINAINDNGNRLVMVDKNTDKDAIKEFLVTTLSKCDTNGNFIETPYSKSKLLDDFLEDRVLNITIYYSDNRELTIGDKILNMADENFASCPHLPIYYVKQQVDKYWDTIEYFINELK